MLRSFIVPAMVLAVPLCSAQQRALPGAVDQRIASAKLRGELFQPVALFAEEGRSPATDALWSGACDRADVLRFVPEKAAALIGESSGHIALALPSVDGTLILDLERVRITATDFRLVVSDGRVMEAPVAAHFQGVVRGMPGSLAAVSVFPEEVSGLITTSAGAWNLGRFEQGPEDLHVLYRDDRLRGRFPYGCATPDDGEAYAPEELETAPGARTMRCVRLYWEGAYAITQQKGSVANATNYLTGLFNQHAILFSNDGIDVVLQELFVWDEPSPYDAGTKGGRLDQFGQFRTSFNGDLAHLLDYGGMGGVAWLNTLCSSTSVRMAYSGINSSYNNVPTYSWSVMVVAHEEGHNMGSRHTHACVWNGNNTAIDGCGPAAGYSEGSCAQGPLPPSSVGGTIMSYCDLTSSTIKFQEGFGPQPSAVMINRINSATCLPFCGTTCDAPQPLSFNALASSSVNLTWANFGATSYTLQWRPTTSGTWTTVSGIVTTSYSLSGLSPETEYEFRVRSECTGASSAYGAPLAFTTPLPCTDPYEPNNSVVQATVVTLPALVSGLISPANDNDYFRFTLAASGTITMYLYNLPADYDLRLRDNSGNILATSQNGGTTPEYISGNAPAGTYHAHVYGWSGANNPEVCYTLSISYTQGCSTPQELGTTMVTWNSALVLWEEVSIAGTYDLRWRPTGEQTWTTVTGISGTSHTINSLAPATSYEVQVRSVCGGVGGQGSASDWSQTHTFTTLPAPCEVVPWTVVDLRVWLDGPYDTQLQLMHDSLRDKGLVPLAEPYSAMGHTLLGPLVTTPSVLAITGTGAVVDWVLVELRTAEPPFTVLEARAGLLLRDGQVVAVDGSSPLGFCQAAGSYRVAVRHRNHLGCMTGASIPLDATSTEVDLRSAATTTWGTNARRTRGSAQLLWAGNASGDNKVLYTSDGNDRDMVLQALGGVIPTVSITGYHVADVNLDGRVKYTGGENDRDRILDTIGGVVPTAERVQQLP